MVEKVRETLGTRFIKLLVDPSISTRLDEFIDFSIPIVQSRPGIGLLDLRKAFRESLGKTTVYRVALLNQSELESVKKEGFVASLCRGNELDAGEIVWNGILRFSPNVRIHAGMVFLEDSPFVSVSNYPRMAMHAATVAEREKIEDKIAQGYTPYLFPIEMYEFDLVRYSWYLEHELPPPLGRYRDQKEELSIDDTGNEAFVQFRIPPEQIVFSKIETFAVEDIPQYEWVAPDNLDNIVTLTEEAQEYLKRHFSQSPISEERFISLPVLGVVSLFSIPDLEGTTGHAIWIGKTDNHPDYKDWDNPTKRRQPVFVDSRFYYDKAFINTEIIRAAVDSGIVTAEEIDALLESAKSSYHNL